MSFDYSSSYYMTQQTSLGTLQLLTQSNQQFSPIHNLQNFDSQCSSDVRPIVLFKNRGNAIQQVLHGAQKSTEKVIFHFQANQLYQSFEINTEQSRNLLQAPAQNYVEQPLIVQFNNFLPRIERLFDDSSIDEIPENSIHNIDINYEESRKTQNQEHNGKNSLDFANEQLQLLKHNIKRLQTIVQKIDNNGKSTLQHNCENLHFDRNILKSHQEEHYKESVMHSLNAKSTKSQSFKNYDVQISRAISQFQCKIINNEEQLQQLQQMSPIPHSNSRKLETNSNINQNSSRDLMRKKICFNSAKSILHSA